jgi:GntR family transcriptional regulator of bglA
MKKYEFISQDLYQRIKKKEFIENKKIPTEDQLIAEYEVSRNTIRNAIKELVKLGILYPVQGSGMFIKEAKKPHTVYLNSTRGVTTDHSNHNITNKVISLELQEANKELSVKMQCEVGTPIYYIIRFRLMDDVPYAVEYTYYNKDIIPYINKEIAEKSIFDYIKNDLKLSFGFADKYIGAKKINAFESELLDLQVGDPSIVIEDSVYLTNGTLFNASKIVYNYKLAHFFMVAQ